MEAVVVMEGPEMPDAKVGWCRFTVSKPVFKAPMVSALETVI